MKVKLILTEDGSHSLYLPELKETYHSFHGAIQESSHVYIKNGLRYWNQLNPHKSVSILEVGFGTGLNALLTFSENNNNETKINFITLEPFPLDNALIEELNYGQLLKQRNTSASINYQEVFIKIHQAPWKEVTFIHDNFTLQKQESTLESISEDPEKYDLIFFDAFAPNKQPELWKLEIFEKTYRLMKRGGFLVTYCAQGQFKRNLNMAGFSVETLQGPPGKKEMVRAAKI